MFRCPMGHESNMWGEGMFRGMYRVCFGVCIKLSNICENCAHLETSRNFAGNMPAVKQSIDDSSTLTTIDTQSCTLHRSSLHAPCKGRSYLKAKHLHACSLKGTELPHNQAPPRMLLEGDGATPQPSTSTHAPCRGRSYPKEATRLSLFLR